MNDLAGTWTLVRFQLRLDRVKLPAWAGGIGLFVVYVITAIDGVLGTEEELADVMGLYSGPLGRLLIGPSYGFDDPTRAGVVANAYGLYLMVIAALMSIFLVVRHTRVEEQTGRAELVRASVVGRHATLAATLVVAAVTNVAAAMAVLVAMVGVGGFDTSGSALLAASIGAVGLAFAGVAAVTAQLSEHSRNAAGMAGAGLGIAFLLRAGGDLVREGGSALSWASPLGWGQQTAPFVLDRWWPLILLVALAVGASALGFVLSTRRDLGAGMVAVRPGPARARPGLGTPLGLAWRLGRGSLATWAAALVVTGLVCGAFADAVLDAADDLPEAFVDIIGADDLLAGYLAYIARFMAYLVAMYAVLAVQRVRTEEDRGRAAAVMAAGVTRGRWLGSHLVVTAVGVVAISVLVGAATGAGAAIVTGDASHLADLTAAQLNTVPAVLVVLGVAVALFGARLRAVPLTWGLLGYAFVLGTFGNLFDLPQIAFDLSPFEHAAELPVEGFAATPLVVLMLVAGACTAAGFAALRRRDIDAS